ncbi:hypothetical protein AAC387_Pa03g1090 [Persea americana]
MRRKTLASLIERESSTRLPPFWEITHFRCYRNVLANSTRTAHAHPLPLHSGIFEGEFGSDNVLLILSLVAATRLTAELPHFTDITGEEVEIPPGCCRSLILGILKRNLEVLKYGQIQGEESDGTSFPETTVVIVNAGLDRAWFAPFSSIEDWRRLIVEGLDNELPRLQVLLRIISLQSAIKHGVVGLPGKTVEDSFVEFSEEERREYDEIESDS